MPMNRAGVGRLAIRPVNDRRIAQISGKILIARSNSIVGRIKSQATARSDRPRTRTAVAGTPKATPSVMPLALFVTDIACPLVDQSDLPGGLRRRGRFQTASRRAVRKDPCLPA